MIIIPNRFITKIEQAIGTVDIDALKEYVKSPTEFERKDDVPMMCMAEFWIESLGRAYYNFKSIDDEWLALDVDDNMKITDFMTQFADYDYILYTSFNHTAEHHKFRVLLHYCGLDYSLLGANLDEIKSNWHFTLETMFPWADKNAMDMTRAFYLPAARPEYFYHINETGKKFYLPMMKRPILKTEGYDGIIAKHYKNNTTIDAHKKKNVEYYLSTSFNKINGNGNSNTSLYNAICTCLACHDDSTLEEVIRKARNEKWSESEIRTKIECARRFVGR